MQAPGNQYPKDNKLDPSGFLRQARLHQSVFRAKHLGLPFDTYGNYLTKEDAEKGKNFYDGFGGYTGHIVPLIPGILCHVKQL